MTATPDTEAPRGYHQPVTWVPLMKQPNLPHQYDLKFCLAKTRVRAVCNCGWESQRAWSPTDEKSSQLARVEYQGHLIREDVEVEQPLTYEEHINFVVWL